MKLPVEEGSRAFDFVHQYSFLQSDRDRKEVKRNGESSTALINKTDDPHTTDISF